MSLLHINGMAELTETHSANEITRHWLDWNQPMLPQAAHWLIDTCSNGQLLDLSDVVVVLPGAKAVARLTELLVSESEHLGLFFTPPEIITTGGLPEKLYKSKLRFASESEQLIGWVRALKSSPHGELSKILGERIVGDQWTNWLPLAKSLIELHRELSSEVLTFRKVANQVADISDFPDVERWEMLARIQRRYFDILEMHELWDRQTARTVAVFNNECETSNRIVLIGTVDLNRSLRQMLKQVGSSVDVLVAGKESLKDRFDEIGCLVPDKWQNDVIDIDPSRIETAGTPAEQAERVIDWLAALGGRYCVDEIQIGVPDSQVTPYVHRALEEIGVKSRDLSGQPITLARPVTLLKAIGEYLESSRWDAFAALVRHPDVYEMVSNKIKNASWLHWVDVFQNETLPARISLESIPRQLAQSRLQPACQAMQQWLSPAFGNHKSATECCQLIRDLMLAIYADQRINRTEQNDQINLFALGKIQAAILELETASTVSNMEFTVADAIRLLSGSISSESFVKKSDPASLELAGWLELPLSDASAICITGMNDGTVPSVEATGMFLPNSLRTKLGLMNNSRRYARDAYAIQVVNHSRNDVRFIMGRRDIENSPLLPSRLLMSCSNVELPARALSFFNHKSNRPPRFWLNQGKPFANEQTLPVPEPAEKWPMDRLFSVTDFKKYLVCPYRFYLSRILRLQEADDRAFELEAAQYGDLVHRIVEMFGRSEVKHSPEADKITEFVLDQLQTISREQFDTHRQVAVSIQLKQLERRLKAFADAQAKWRKDGWLIQEVESNAYKAKLDVDGIAATIQGRIDRIDKNEDDGHMVVLDYKAFENYKSPLETHVKRKTKPKKKTEIPLVEKDDWIDLQLPLYYQLIAQSRFQAIDQSKIDVGYFVIPRAIKDTKIAFGKWTEGELDGAFERAREIISNIRKQRFWPPIEPPPEYDDFPQICQIDVLEQWTDQGN